MKKRRNKILLSAALLSIPIGIVTMGSTKSNAMLRTVIKNGASKIPIVKPPLPPKPNFASPSKGNVLSRVSMFNGANKTQPKRSPVNVGKLNIDLGMKTKLEGILGNQNPSTPKPSVGKLNLNSKGSITSALGGGNKSGSSLDLSKLPSTPPPPPPSITQTQKGPSLTNTNNGQGSIPTPPPLPSSSQLTSRGPTHSGNPTSGISKPSGTSSKPSLSKGPQHNPQHNNLMNELKSKLKLRN